MLRQQDMSPVLCGLIVLLPSFMEARLVWQLEPQVQNFVSGQEGASCDCGLVIDGASGPSLINNSSKRLTDAVRLCGDEAKVALLDFKTCSPVADKSYKGSWCFYEVCVKQTQRDACTAFIIQNPAAPHLVALVPQYYLARNKPPGRKYVYQSAVLPLFDEEQEHFPMSFAPFVMPVVLLPQALQSLDLFCRIPGVKWRNPWNGIRFDSCPAPKLFPIDLLQPPKGSHLNDFPVIEMLRSAFSTHSTSYRIEHMTLRALVGDFQIVHLQTGVSVFVEMKSGMVWLTQKGDVVHRAYHDRSTNQTDDTARYYFSATSLWDFILTYNDKTKQAFFWSRDDLPAVWFILSSGRFLRRKHPERSMIEHHFFEWDEHMPRKMVKAIEKVLDGRLVAGLKAQVVRPFVSEGQDEDQTQLQNATTSDDGGKYALTDPPKVQPVRGTVSAWSRSNYGYEQEVRLRGLCKREGYGAIYDLCEHPVATHVFAGIEWSGNQCPSFFELGPNTPMVYLTFAPVSDLDQKNPNDKRRPVLFTGATHPQHPQIYLLNPWPDSLKAYAYNFKHYVVPSGMIQKTQKRMAASEVTLNRDYKSGNRVAVAVTFNHTELVDEFGVRKDGIVQWLRQNIFEPPVDLQESDHEEDEHEGPTVQPEKYLTLQRDVARQYLRVWNREVAVTFHRQANKGADEVEIE